MRLRIMKAAACAAGSFVLALALAAPAAADSVKIT